MAQNNSSNNFGTAKWIVDSTAGQGTHTTIAAALTAASSGQTIFIRPGTYTEDLTLKAGVDLSSYVCDSSLNGTGNVIISGTNTFTAAGSVSISGIQLQTNSAALLAVTGSAASNINLIDCYLNCTNSSGITFSTSDSTAKIQIKDCQGDLGTTGIKIFAHTSAGTLNFYNCDFTNSGASVTASTQTAGTINCRRVHFSSPVTTSSTATLIASNYQIGCSAINTTALTAGGSGAHNFFWCFFDGGSASAVSISNTTTQMHLCDIASSNTNAVTGAGTLTYEGLAFSGTSFLMNTTTQTGGLLKGGQTQAPSAGFIGEVISSTATSIATSTSTAKSIASINITAGVWNVSAMSFAAPTGGTGLMTTHATGIGTTNNTLTGTGGIDFTQSNVADTTKSNCVGPIRVTLTATTTYYVVVLNTYTSTTCPTNATITATRVG